MRKTWLAPFAAVGLILAAAPVSAQFHDPAARMAAQREAMARLAGMDGIWRGPAWTMTPAGRRELIQTERAGAFLDGTVRVFEGRGYEADGSVGFNALGIISFDPATRSYTVTSWAMGYSVVAPLRLTDTGFVWEVPAGPDATIRYTATIGADSWLEVGERIAGDAPPVRITELNLRRIGDADWPAAGAVPMR